MDKFLICALLLAFINYGPAAVNGQRPFYLGLGQKPTCVNEGDYCSANVDCCSQSCASTTRRCVTAVAADPSINDVTSPATATTILSTLESRFNEAEGQQECRGLSAPCAAGQDCCSRTCLAAKCANAECSGVGRKCSSTARGCCDFLTCEADVCQDRAVLVEGTETFGYQEPEGGVHNRFGEDETLNRTTTQTSPTPCKEVGEKCYKHEQCCSPLKCHSFLHQCVT